MGPTKKLPSHGLAMSKRTKCRDRKDLQRGMAREDSEAQMSDECFGTLKGLTEEGVSQRYWHSGGKGIWGIKGTDSFFLKGASKSRKEEPTVRRERERETLWEDEKGRETYGASG